MKNRFKERYFKNSYNVDILDYLKKYNTFRKNFSVVNIKKNKNTITGYILYKQQPIYNDYMDDVLRDYTQNLSEKLRDIIGKSVYYDIIDGKIIIQV